MFADAVLSACGDLLNFWIGRLRLPKRTRRGRMRLAILSSQVLIAAGGARAQRKPTVDPPSACDLQAADIPGKVFEIDREHDRLTGDAKLVAEVNKRFAEILQIAKDTWPGQKGFEAKYYRVLVKDEPETVGPYNFYAVLVSYECKYDYDSKTNKYTPTGTFISPDPNSFMFGYVKALTLHIGINSKRNLFTGELNAHVGGRMRTIYQTADYVEELDGFRVYGRPDLGKRKIVYFGRPGAQPYLPVTQRQYMNALMEHSEEKFGTPGHPGFFRGSFSHETVDMTRADIRRYLAEASEAELNSPAKTCAAIGTWSVYGPHQSAFDGKSYGAFESFKQHKCELLVVNPEYFRKDLPNYVPQLITIEWEQPQVTEVSRILEQRFRATFPARKLQALLDK